MATFKTTYVSDGATTQYDVPFRYLRREHVRAALSADGTALPFTWVNNGRIRLNRAPEAGQSFHVERSTPSTPIHVVANNRPIPAQVYNDLILQALYVSEEVSMDALASGTLTDITDAADQVISAEYRINELLRDYEANAPSFETFYRSQVATGAPGSTLPDLATLYKDTSSA